MLSAWEPYPHTRLAEIDELMGDRSGLAWRPAWSLFSDREVMLVAVGRDARR